MNVPVLRSVGDAAARESLLAGASRPKAVRVPTIVLVVAVLVVLVNVAVMFAGAWAIGVTTDEPTHLMRFQNLLDSGWYAESSELTDGVLTSSSRKVYAYGPVVAWLGHTAAVVAGIEEPGRVIAPVANYTDIVATPAQYGVRHTVVALIAVVGMAAVAAITRLVTGSWRWGVLAAAALSAVPMWTGHAMFNGKDVPVAVGYTLVTLGAVALAQREVFDSRVLRWGGVGALVAGVVLALGTRPGIWPALAASVLVLLGGTRIASGRRMRSAPANALLRARAALVAGAGLLSAVILAVTYPKVFLNPVGALWHSVRVSSQFVEWDGWTLSAGVAHRQPPPLWYLPAWFGNQVPVLLLAAALIGLVGVGYLVVRVLMKRSRNATLMTGLALVAAQVVFLPGISVLARSHVYSGVRQMLFVVPGLAVLAAVGGRWLIARLARSRRFGSGPYLSAAYAVAVLALVLPSVDQARLFPFGYTYFNEVATLRPIDGRWATDYWQASYRELAESIGPAGAIACPNRYGVDQAGLAAQRFPAPDPPGCTRPTMTPFLAERSGSDASGGVGPAAPGGEGADAPGAGGVDAVGGEGVDSTGAGGADASGVEGVDASGAGGAVDASPGAAQFWFVQTNYLGEYLPANCETVATVHRPLRGQQVTMSYLALCQDDDPGQ